MRKTYKIIIIIVAVVWIFASGLLIGTYKIRSYFKRAQESLTMQQSTVPTSEATSQSTELQIDIITNVAPETQTSTTEFTLELPTSGGVITTYASTSNKQLRVPQGNEEIAKALVDAINTTKSVKVFTATRVEKADFSIDSVTGGNPVKTIVEGIINKVGNRPEETYSFSNGVDNNGSSETPNTVIAPKGNTAYLDASAVKSASAAENSYGGYDITLVLNDETQTLSSKAVNHDGLFNTLDMSSLSLPSGFKMDKVDFTYSGAQINASVNSDGRLVSIDYSLPISQGEAQGSMFSATVNVSLHGTYTSSVKITY